MRLIKPVAQQEKQSLQRSRCMAVMMLNSRLAFGSQWQTWTLCVVPPFASTINNAHNLHEPPQNTHYALVAW